MTLLTRDEIGHLATRANGSRVSIYLPTHRASPESDQDPIRFKNLLGSAENDLIARGMRPATAKDLLAPARALLDDHQFWQHRGDGLAVFVSANGVRTYRLPLRVGELEVVADHYYVKPLLSLLGRDGRFFILAVSLHRVRLFEANRDTIRELDLRDIPENLQDAVGYDWEERSLQFHTGTGPGRGAMRAAMFHGHGAPRDDAKDEIATFLRLVDHGVTALLTGDRAPLVLAGVGHILALYRSVTRYPNVVADGVEGNPDHSSPAALLERAWPVVEPRFLADQQAATKRYAALAGTGLASSDLSEVLPAAFDGRVEVLFVAASGQRWGTYDEGSRQVAVHTKPYPGDRDLLDLTAIRCLLTGADVYPVEPQRVPAGGALAAIFRY